MPSDEGTSPAPEDSTPDEPSPSFAWQPMTPRGVAAFAHAPLRRLILIELLVALAAAAAVVWFLRTAWFPTVRRAVDQLPEQGEIRSRRVEMPRPPPELLAESRHLACVVDLEGRSRAGLDSDLRVRFTRSTCELTSLFGSLVFEYPQGWTIQFNRPDLQPRWEAWQPFLLGSAAVIVVATLLCVWGLLATLYCPFVRVMGGLRSRDVTLAGSWKLAAAALMPGALLFTLGIVLYGTGFLDLIRLGALAGLHVIVGWIYVAFSPIFLPPQRVAAGSTANPFTATAPRTENPPNDAHEPDSPGP
jgi:hypothetical protein